MSFACGRPSPSGSRLRSRTGTPGRRRPGGPARVLAALLTVVGLLVAAPAPRATAAPVKPVVNGPVFNDPFGSPARQKAVFTQLVDLVNATPAGQTIRGSMFEFAHRGRFFPRGDSSKIRSACGG